jgi:hypothetical protein
MSSLETVIAAGPEMIENLLKLNFSKVLRGALELRHRKISLLGEELSAPGREVAYVVHAEDSLRGSDRRMK